jgi:aminoglycoside phosphotransferase (APT) family kinase protein
MAETTGNIQEAERRAGVPAPGGSPQAYLGEVGEVRHFAQIDEGRLHEYLRAHLPGYQGPLKVRQFQGGQSNLTYLLETPKARYVLRRQPPGILLKSAHAVDREFRVLGALAGVPGFPVPEPFVMCEDREILGSMYYEMRHVPGRIFRDCPMPDLDPEERAAVFDSANETLARLHTVDYASLGLADFGRPGSYFERQISRWSRQYDQSRTQDIPEMDRLMGWLPAFVPPDDGRSSIIHGDYSFHNLLFHPVEPRVVAVVDWELSTLGHPLGDLMYHTMEWYRPAGVDARGTLRDADLAALGIPSLERYIERYCERTGLMVDGNLTFYRAYNLFRTAAILQGIAHRLEAGNAASGNAAEIAANVRPLANAAWRFAQEGGAVG